MHGKSSAVLVHYMAEIEEVKRGHQRTSISQVGHLWPSIFQVGHLWPSIAQVRHSNFVRFLLWPFVVQDGKLLCTLVDKRRISGDFYAAVGGDRLALIAGKMLKIYDLTVHSGVKT